MQSAGPKKKSLILKVVQLMFRSIYIPEATRCDLQRLSDMQAVLLYVGMCRCSCAYTNKLVFVCNRCAPETWGATLQVTSSPRLSLLTWETRRYICQLSSCTHTLFTSYQNGYAHISLVS